MRKIDAAFGGDERPFGRESDHGKEKPSAVAHFAVERFRSAQRDGGRKREHLVFRPVGQAALDNGLRTQRFAAAGAVVFFKDG